MRTPRSRRTVDPRPPSDPLVDADGRTLRAGIHDGDHAAHQRAGDRLADDPGVVDVGRDARGDGRARHRQRNGHVSAVADLVLALQRVDRGDDGHESAHSAPSLRPLQEPLLAYVGHALALLDTLAKFNGEPPSKDSKQEAAKRAARVLAALGSYLRGGGT